MLGSSKMFMGGPASLSRPRHFPAVSFRLPSSRDVYVSQPPETITLHVLDIARQTSWPVWSRRGCHRSRQIVRMSKGDQLEWESARLHRRCTDRTRLIRSTQLRGRYGGGNLSRKKRDCRRLDKLPSQKLIASTVCVGSSQRALRNSGQRKPLTRYGIYAASTSWLSGHLRKILVLSKTYPATVSLVNSVLTSTRY